MSQKDESSSAFIDLMTSLAVIFILLFVCVVNEKDATHQAAPTPAAPQEKVAAKPKPKIKDSVDEALDTAKMAREGILSKLINAFKADKLEVERDPNDVWTLVVVIRQQELTFATDKWALNNKGRETVEKVFAIIEPIVCFDYKDKVDWVTVEGHTDIEGNATLGGQINNIDLSSRRAASVVHYALQTLHHPKNKGVQNDLRCIRALLSPRGMGSSHPRSTGTTKKLQQDRRVEVKVHVKSPPTKDVDVVDDPSKVKDAIIKSL